MKFINCERKGNFKLINISTENTFSAMRFFFYGNIFSFFSIQNSEQKYIRYTVNKSRSLIIKYR